MSGGFYRLYETPTGTAIEWCSSRRVSRREAEYRRLFPDGVPLRGPLTPAQQRWMRGRS